MTRSFMSPRSYPVKVALAVGIGLAVVGACCVAATRLFPAPANCVEQSRNPYRFRDWEHYAEGMKGTGEAGVVALISDSQGYAGEYAAHRGYPARLEALLNERQPGGIARWEVLNFSMDGATPMEYMALAARLQEARPTWVISISGSADFRAENAIQGFSYARTDLPWMLTRWDLARRMPAGFWERHGRVEDTLSAWMARRMPLLRFRGYMWSWLDTRYPGAQRAFYAPQTTYRFWELPGKARTALVPRADAGAKSGPVDQTIAAASRVMLDDFLAQVAAVPAEYRLVATAPMRKDPDDPALAQAVALYRRDIAELTAEHGLPFRDWTEALPPKDFITTSHFHDRNHRRMAELLADTIAAEMKE